MEEHSFDRRKVFGKRGEQYVLDNGHCPNCDKPYEPADWLANQQGTSRAPYDFQCVQCGAVLGVNVYSTYTGNVSLNVGRLAKLHIPNMKVYMAAVNASTGAIHYSKLQEFPRSPTLGQGSSGYKLVPVKSYST